MKGESNPCWYRDPAHQLDTSPAQSRFILNSVKTFNEFHWCHPPLKHSPVLCDSRWCEGSYKVNKKFDSVIEPRLCDVSLPTAHWTVIISNSVRTSSELHWFWFEGKKWLPGGDRALPVTCAPVCRWYAAVVTSFWEARGIDLFSRLW